MTFKSLTRFLSKGLLLIGALLMPLGLNRHGTFSQGIPVTLPKNFGTSITLPKNFGNRIGIQIGPTAIIADAGGSVSNTTPAVVATSSGEYFLVYNQTHFKMSRRSTDQGMTWSNEIQQWDANSIDPTLARTPKGHLLVEFGKNNAQAVEGAAYARSVDQGLTWSGFTFFDNPIHNTIFTPTLYLNDGLDMYASGYNSTVANVWKSTDDGLTWVKISNINTGADHKINETSLIKVGPNSFLAISRDAASVATYGHFSTDGGLTWGAEIDYTSQVGVLQLPQLIQLDSAILLFAKDLNASAVVVFASYNGGKTFTDRTVLDTYPAGVDSTGYSWPILKENGDVYVVWSATTLASPTRSVIKALTLHWK